MNMKKPIKANESNKFQYRKILEYKTFSKLNIACTKTGQHNCNSIFKKFSNILPPSVSM